MMCDENKDIQTSPTLVVLPLATTDLGETQVGIFDFCSSNFATCSTNVLFWLSFFLKPRTFDDARTTRPEVAQNDIREQLNTLINMGFLSLRGTSSFTVAERYRKDWAWNIFVGAFHFSSLDGEFVSLEDSVEFQLQKLETEPQPTSSGMPIDGRKKQLPSVAQSRSSQLLKLLAKRRTNRNSTGYILSAQELGDCLFSGFGITHHVQTPAGPRPLSLAPSGGARNPYEAFIFIRHCHHFQAGVYHYSAIDHALTFVRALPDDFECRNFWVDRIGRMTWQRSSSWLRSWNAPCGSIKTQTPIGSC